MYMEHGSEFGNDMIYIYDLIKHETSGFQRIFITRSDSIFNLYNCPLY